VTAFLVAFSLVFVAEIGDKSQLLVLAFASRYRARVVIPAILFATAVMQLLSVTVGEAAGRLLPLFWIHVLSGLAFIAFGIWSLRPEKGEEEEREVASRFGPMVTIAATFLISELGDKTMLTAIAVAGQQRNFLAVWLGSTAGMSIADCISLVVGYVLGKKLPEKAIRYGAAAIFLASGVFTLFRAFLSPGP
jgi:putative Ca2+/H+ antiporter (TMEM165/GDT1 family)